ncbi:MAG: SBBP repeat-containing protein [Flavobacteriales bacterium]|nr:SBBP repeat-containing protein [Flavobacteriales bacterium]
MNKPTIINSGLKALLLLAVFISSQTFSNAQYVNLEWAVSAGSNNTEGGNSVVTDAAGNVYSTGMFQGIADFDPGVDTFLLYPNWTITYIQKLDAAGNFVWAKSINADGINHGSAIAIDAFGDVLVAGYYRGTADFDPGSGVYNLTSNGGDDNFILKLDSDGNFIWAKSFGGIGTDYCLFVASDESGNVYTTGNFRSEVDFDPGAGEFVIDLVDKAQGYVQKLDVNGDFVWVKTIEGASSMASSSCYSVDLDNTGNVYITGLFNDTADFDPGIAVYKLYNEGAKDVFILKLDGDGDFVWAKSLAGTGNDLVENVVIDYAGNVCIAGSYRGTTDFDPGTEEYNLTSIALYDGFILKLDADGEFIWAKSIGGVNWDYCYAMALDNLGNIFITGYSGDGMPDLDPGVEVYNIEALNGFGIFNLKLNANGEFVWANAIEGGGGSTSFPRGITVDASSNVYVTGYFKGTPDFDPTSGTFEMTSIKSSNSDAFIQKLSQNEICDNGIDDNGDGLIDRNDYNSCSVICPMIVWEPAWITSLGNLCDSNLVLSFGGNLVDSLAGPYQWFLSGVALVGETSDELDVSGNLYGAGDYYVHDVTQTCVCGYVYFADCIREICDNGIDDDGDGLIDLNDDDCECVGCEYEICNNGIDDDGNGLIDLNDTTKCATCMESTYGNMSGSLCTGDVHLSYPPTVVVFGFPSNGFPTCGIQRETFEWFFNGVAIEEYPVLNNGQYTSGGFILITSGFGTADFYPADYGLGAGTYSVRHSYGAVGSSCFHDCTYQSFEVSCDSTTVGVNDALLANEIVVFPNPSNGNFSIDLGDELRDCQVTITDLIGRKISENNFENSRLIDLNIDAPSGVYLITIRSAGEQVVVKLVRE